MILLSPLPEILVEAFHFTVCINKWFSIACKVRHTLHLLYLTSIIKSKKHILVVLLYKSVFLHLFVLGHYSFLGFLKILMWRAGLQGEQEKPRKRALFCGHSPTVQTELCQTQEPRAFSESSTRMQGFKLVSHFLLLSLAQWELEKR